MNSKKTHTQKSEKEQMNELRSFIQNNKEVVEILKRSLARLELNNTISACNQ